MGKSHRDDIFSGFAPTTLQTFQQLFYRYIIPMGLKKNESKQSHSFLFDETAPLELNIGRIEKVKW
jgi:hypothetical protein